MTYLDAALCIALAARIHRDPARVRATAKKCLKRMPRAQHGALPLIASSRDPLAVVEHMLENLE